MGLCRWTRTPSTSYRLVSRSTFRLATVDIRTPTDPHNPDDSIKPLQGRRVGRLEGRDRRGEHFPARTRVCVLHEDPVQPVQPVIRHSPAGVTVSAPPSRLVGSPSDGAAATVA